MKRFKKILAGIMAATLVVGSATVVMADDRVSTESGVEEGSTGSGSVEATVDKKVFSVVLPTLPEEGSPFDFILDPEGVIEATSGSAYENDYALKATGSMYFFQSSPAALHTQSDTLMVTNKSSVDVNITLTAKVTTATDAGIRFATDSAFGSATDKAVYFELNGVDATSPTSAAVTASSAGLGITTVTAKMASANAYYYVDQSTASGYQYVLNEASAAGHFATYGFYVTGDCNTNADWTGYTDSASLEVIWKLEGVGMETVLAKNPTFKSTAAGVIKWVDGTETQVGTITSIKMTNSSGTYEALNASGKLWAATVPDYDTDSITINANFLTYFTGAGENVATITYTDSTNGNTQTATVTVKMP